MKLLSVNLARSIWFGHFGDLNPRGKSLYPAIPPLIELYKFKKFPPLTEVPDFDKGIKFEEGEFKNAEGDIVGLNFNVFTDGIVAESRSSTKDTDDFLVEVLKQVSENFALPQYEKIIKRKSYVSQLYVTTDKVLELLNPKLKELSNYLSDHFTHPFEIGALYFIPDNTAVFKPAPFIFERAINIPFSEKRYYTSAPLPTEKHLQFLDKLESIL